LYGRKNLVLGGDRRLRELGGIGWGYHGREVWFAQTLRGVFRRFPEAIEHGLS
jgi:hypothetical protein